MDFANATSLDSSRLEAIFLRHTEPYCHDDLCVRVRYSRSADFSGTCFYRDARLHVNLGRHVRYPYTLATHVARAQSGRGYWFRPCYRLTLHDGYQLALFIYLHELYHFLVKAAGRSVRRREGMCDRFATRVLVDCYGCAVTDPYERPVPRDVWDFQDLHGFVARAPQEHRRPAGRPIPVRIYGLRRPRN